MPVTELTASVLQVGFGGFGPVHLEAWCQLGFRDRLWIADPDLNARKRALGYGLPADRLIADYRDVLDQVAIVDVVVPTDRHIEICKAAITAGKDVFAEKPLTMGIGDARELSALVHAHECVLQVGFYFRHHPLSLDLQDRVAGGDLGRLRYLSGNFTGFKRARRDVGATGNDAVHFIDLFNWLLGRPPVEVYAIRRDHFGRGLDDLALILLTYPDGVVGKIEAGYIQPGRWVDNFVPNALSTKEVQVCGIEGAIEVDYQAERLTWHKVHHERRDDGLWWPAFEDARTPMIGRRQPVDVLSAEFRCFLDHVAARTMPDANVDRSGVEIAMVLEAIERSAEENRPVDCRDGAAQPV